MIQVIGQTSPPLKDGDSFKEQNMKPNVGTIDRILRIALGLGLIAASVLGYIGVWGWVGLVPLATGIFRVCPAYLPLGLSTCASGSGSAKR